MQNKVASSRKKYFFRHILLVFGGLFFVGQMVVPYGKPHEVNAATQSLSTSVYLRIYHSFSGSLTFHTGAGIEISNVFYTAQADQLVWVEVSSPGIFRYTLSGDVSSGAHGSITGGTTTTQAFSLSQQEGPLSFFGIFTSAGGATSGDIYTTPYLNYFLDLSAPQLTTSLSGPSGIIHPGDPLYFSRSPVIDTGAGLAGYHIQLSRNNSFNTYIEFSTQQAYLDLAIGSIDSGRWYRRRVGEDLVGNKQFSPSFVFRIPPGGPATIQEDICPNGDSSGSPYDGICSITLTPSLINTPPEHQAPDNWSRIDETRKAIAYLTNIAPREQEQAYLFPNYSAPIPYTIYEYPDIAGSVMETVYEESAKTEEYTHHTDSFVEEVLKQQQIGYLENNTPTTTTTKTPQKESIIENRIAFRTQSGPDRSYLQVWYMTTQPLCQDYFQACIIIPHCPDMYTDCMFWSSEISCTSKSDSLQSLSEKDRGGPERCIDI